MWTVASDSVSLNSSETTAESLEETSCAFVFGWNVKSVLIVFSLLFGVGHFTFKSFLRLSVVSNLLNTYSGLYCVWTDFVVVCFPTGLSTVVKGSAPMHFSEVSWSSCMSSL